jgi:hypothetical protein
MIVLRVDQWKFQLVVSEIPYGFLRRSTVSGACQRDTL